MILTYKNYLKWLFVTLALILIAAFLYAAFFIRNYPLPITNRISFDAKLKFIKESIDRDKVDTLIVGSSIGLNNVQGTVLEENSTQCRTVLNLSVYEASALEVEEVLELRSLFPHLRRVVYSAQFPDFAVASRFADYHPDLIAQYLNDSFTPWEHIVFLFHMCQNLFFCIQRQWNYLHKHNANNQFGYLGFDRSGSVPLHIYGDDIIRSRWEQPHWTKQSPENYQALARIVQALQREKIRFYFVIQPYRKPLLERYPQTRTTLSKFAQKTLRIVREYGGSFIDFNQALPLDDRYFADRSHLNDQGSSIISEQIARYIDLDEKEDR